MKRANKIAGQITLTLNLTEDKNISILHSPCRTSDLQFLVVLQPHALVLKIVCTKESGGGEGGGGGGGDLTFLISLLK